jgi:hypothetical protein
MEQTSTREDNISSASQDFSLHFIEPKSSIPNSEATATLPNLSQINPIRDSP